MLIQTNYPAIKASQGTPVEIVEEWLAENAAKNNQLTDNHVKGDTYFNNTNTNDIKRRHARNKRKEKETQAAIIKYSGKPIRPKKSFNVSDESFTDIKSQVKKRFLAGEVVRVTDYKKLYAPTTMRVITSKVVSDLKSSGFEVVIMQTQDKKVLGWVLERSFNDTFLTKDNANAVRKRLEPVDKSLSSQDIFHQTVEEIGDRLLAGQYVRIDEYTAKHSRTVVLRMADLAMQIIKKQNDVVYINYKLGKRAGWILKDSLLKKIKEAERK